MTHLILGSSGQIGSALVNYYKQKNEKVILYDIVNNTLQDLRVEANPELERYIIEADFVHFLAFDVGGSRYLKTYQYTSTFISNNLRLMEFTFSLLQKHNKRFIFASSQMSNMTYSPYGILKALGEVYTKSLNGIIVKFWNVYGVEHDLNKSHVITDFILMARDSKEIKMLTDGTEQRQFLHALDCSKCLDILSNKYSSIDRNEELHITNFKWNSILDVAEIISTHFPDIIISPSMYKDEVQKDKRNEPNESILKYWRPEITLESGISMIIKELENN
jgi:nucleoside-diphosphate-sugar epimerase